MAAWRLSQDTWSAFSGYICSTARAPLARHAYRVSKKRRILLRGSALLLSCSDGGPPSVTAATLRWTERPDWSTAHRIAQPLNGRDADGTVKHAGPQRHALPQVMQTQIALNLPVCSHVQHGRADVKSLQKDHSLSLIAGCLHGSSNALVGCGQELTTHLWPASARACPESPEPQPKSRSSLGVLSSGKANNSSALCVRVSYVL